MTTSREITGTGWLSPEGEFVECPSYDHISAAEDICEELGCADYIHPDGRLLDNGWIQVSILRFVDHGFMFYIKQSPTEEQKQVLRRFYDENGLAEFGYIGISESGLAELCDAEVISYEEWMERKEEKGNDKGTEGADRC